MKNKTLTKKMKEQLVGIVLEQIITESCLEAKQEVAIVASQAFYSKYGFPGTPQYEALNSLPIEAMPHVAEIPVIVKMNNSTAVTHNVKLMTTVPFAQGMLPVVIPENDILPLLDKVAMEEKDTSTVKKLVEAAFEEIPGTFKAIQLWPELLPFIIGSFYPERADQIEGVPESIIKAKNAIEELLTEKLKETPKTDFDEILELIPGDVDLEPETEDTNK